MLFPPIMNDENYDLLIVEEKRYLDNIKNVFEVEQIAYLYLFDPLGIEYYMRTNASDGKDIMSGEFLTFKDEVYEAIFGTTERSNGKFYFTIVNEQPFYKKHLDSSRMDVYSNAEVLFGFHTIIDWNFNTFIKSFLEGAFKLVLDKFILEDSIFKQGIEAYQLLFHSGGILGACSNKAYSYVKNYFDENISDHIADKLGGNAKKVTSWGFNLIVLLVESALSSFSIPNPMDITIYNAVNIKHNYLTIFEVPDSKITMTDIIDHVNQN